MLKVCETNKHEEIYKFKRKYQISGSGSWFWRLLHRTRFRRRLARNRCSPGRHDHDDDYNGDDDELMSMTP